MIYLVPSTEIGCPSQNGLISLAATVAEEDSYPRLVNMLHFPATGIYFESYIFLTVPLRIQVPIKIRDVH